MGGSGLYFYKAHFSFVKLQTTFSLDSVLKNEKKKKKVGRGVQAHNPHQRAGGEGRRGAICLRPAWSTYDAPGQPGLQSNTLSQTKQQEIRGSSSVRGLTGKTGKYTLTMTTTIIPREVKDPSLGLMQMELDRSPWQPERHGV